MKRMLLAVVIAAALAVAGLTVNATIGPEFGQFVVTDDRTDAFPFKCDWDANGTLNNVNDTGCRLNMTDTDAAASYVSDDFIPADRIDIDNVLIETDLMGSSVNMSVFYLNGEGVEKSGQVFDLNDGVNDLNVSDPDVYAGYRYELVFTSDVNKDSPDVLNTTVSYTTETDVLDEDAPGAADVVFWMLMIAALAVIFIGIAGEVGS